MAQWLATIKLVTINCTYKNIFDSWLLQNYGLSFVFKWFQILKALGLGLGIYGLGLKKVTSLSCCLLS